MTAWDGLAVKSISRISGGAVRVVPAPVTYGKPLLPQRVPTIRNDGQPYLCRTCSFMPWAQTGSVSKVLVSVLRGAIVVRVVPAVRQGDGWVDSIRLQSGESAPSRR